MFKKLVLFVSMIGMLSLGFTQIATASQRKPLARSFNFYATAAKVQLVGYRDVDCDGNVTVWGVTTEHFTLQGFPCN